VQLAKNMGGLMALNQLASDAATDGIVRALAARLADSGGIAGRQFLADTLQALPKEARGAARKAGIVFGALDVYHHAILKPAATRWRAALFAAVNETPMPNLPPESAVHLKEWDFASAADCRNAGYRKVGNEFVRIDLAERVIKKAHEARGVQTEFAMDMAFATSLGLSEDGLNALMRDAGFKHAVAKVEEAAVVTDEPVVAEVAVEETAEPALEAPEVTELEAVPEAITVEAVKLTHWRWVGIRNAKPQHARSDKPRTDAKPRGDRKPNGARKPMAQPAPSQRNAETAAAPSALALQLAALRDKLGG
jgi:ATP-dependent RNA helicase SUPV3L1/SUV3